MQYVIKLIMKIGKELGYKFVIQLIFNVLNLVF